MAKNILLKLGEEGLLVYTREDKNDTYPGEVNSESLEESMYSTDSDAGDPDFVPGPATRPKPTTAKKTSK
jgi:hypothetical protein